MEPSTPASVAPRRSLGLPACVLLGLVLLLLTGSALKQGKVSAAHRPEQEAQVLARVPRRSTDALRQGVRSLQKPQDLESALVLAREAIERSRRDGDPRPLGHAEALLAPFTRGQDASAQALVLRATLYQARHAFEPALSDLDAALHKDPQNAQALFTRASVLTVRGRFAEARESCRRLGSLVAAPWLTLCMAPIDLATGQAQEARVALDQALSCTRDPAQAAMLHSLRGELAFWLDDLTVSEAHLRRALSLAHDDRYTRALLLDLLLDTGRAREALRSSEPYLADDALLLRAALAGHALGDARAELWIGQLRDTFAANRLRGERVHQREEARLMLALGHDETALMLALEGFAEQKEPWDVRLVLDSARALGARTRAQPVLDFIEKTGFAAPRVMATAEPLRREP